MSEQPYLLRREPHFCCAGIRGWRPAGHFRQVLVFCSTTCKLWKAAASKATNARPGCDIPTRESGRRGLASTALGGTRRAFRAIVFGRPTLRSSPQHRQVAARRLSTLGQSVVRGSRRSEAAKHVGRRVRRMTALFLFALIVMQSFRAADADDAADAIESDYVAAVRPLLERYCFECHARDVTEADIDLAAFKNVADIRPQVKPWLRVYEMIDSQQMPPKDAEQPNEAERARLQNWLHDFLTLEAEAEAGDPGPVILRRLSNDEYNYTIRDLTGVDSLDPTREFPVDGAAGEGFTNTGSSQGMSPALVQKFIDAAKEVANHLVLLPDGIRFSPHVTERDQTDERVAAIRQFYARFAVTTDVNIEVGGAGKVPNEGGAIPLDQYLAA